MLYRHQPVGLEVFEEGSKRFSASTELAASAHRVSRAFECPETWASWIPLIRSVEWTSKPPLGSESTRTVHLVGGILIEERFLVWKSGQRIAFRFDRSNVPGLDALGEDYQIEALGPERCRLSWTVALVPRGVGRTAQLLPRRLGEWGMLRLLRRLEPIVTAEEPGSTG